jgi:hypothetical protein
LGIGLRVESAFLQEIVPDAGISAGCPEDAADRKGLLELAYIFCPAA